MSQSTLFDATFLTCLPVGTRTGDEGFRTNLYWQTPPNWKNVGFRKALQSHDFHRVTRKYSPKGW
jgi:hypothetical protein